MRGTNQETVSASRCGEGRLPPVVAWGDGLVITVLVLLVWLSVWGWSPRQDAGYITVRRGSELVATVPAHGTRRLTVAGELGEVIVVIERGRVHIERARCPNQICVRSGTIAVTGQQLVCAPNRVLVEIQPGPKEGGVDAVTR